MSQGDFDFSVNVPIDAELREHWKEVLLELYHNFMAFLTELASNAKAMTLRTVAEFRHSGLSVFDPLKGRIITTLDQLLEIVKDLAQALSRTIATGIVAVAELTASREFALAEKLTYLMDKIRAAFQVTSNIILEQTGFSAPPETEIQKN